MTAMITQPIESSQIAEATMICPRLRRVKPISRTIAATILIEEIDNAVPRNSEVSRRPSECGRSHSGSSWPSVKPQMKGTATPVTEMLSAALPTVRTSLRSVSIPVSNSSSRMPNCEMPSSIAFCSGVRGKRACCRSGHSAPSTDGPSMMPPSNIPMTEGWPTRFMASPRRRPTSISMTSWARKMTSEGPLWPPSAAQAIFAPSVSAAMAQAPARVHWRAEDEVGSEEVMEGELAPQSGREAIVPSAETATAWNLANSDCTLPCNCKLFATRLWTWDRIISMAVSSVPQERPPDYPETGWRRSRSTPSLSEVFGSVATRPRGPLWKKLLAFLGPGYLVAVGYMDPGNWATSLAGGSKFGYALLTIALLSNLIAILLQALC